MSAATQGRERARMRFEDVLNPTTAAAYAIGVAVGFYATVFRGQVPWDVVRIAEWMALGLGAATFVILYVAMKLQAWAVAWIRRWLVRRGLEVPDVW